MPHQRNRRVIGRRKVHTQRSRYRPQQRSVDSFTQSTGRRSRAQLQRGTGHLGTGMHHLRRKRTIQPTKGPSRDSYVPNYRCRNHSSPRRSRKTNAGNPNSKATKWDRGEVPLPPPSGGHHQPHLVTWQLPHHPPEPLSSLLTTSAQTAN